MKGNLRKIFVMLTFVVGILFCTDVAVGADVRDITLDRYSDSYFDNDHFIVGDKGKFLIDYNEDWYGKLSKISYSSGNTKIVKVDNHGNYTVVGAGEAEVFVTGYDEDGDEAFESSYGFYVYGDTSSMKFSSSSVKLYLTNGMEGKATISLKNAPDLSYCDFDYSCSNRNLGLWCDLNAQTKTIEIYTYNTGSGTVTFTINGHCFVVSVTSAQLKINKTSALVVKKKKTTLKLTGYSGALTWYSTNKKVATVNSKGVVKAKKVGNTVIYTKVNDAYVGCAVSVVTSKMKKVIKESKKIVKGKYSQAKRMKKGYYDCSSLVWRSYAKAKKYLVNKHYAPVAADLAKHYVKKKKKIKGGLTQKNLQNMKLRPGDLYFCEGTNNGRYRGINHVELFTGYDCTGFTEQGKPIVSALWASVRADYYAYNGGLMCRP